MLPTLLLLASSLGAGYGAVRAEAEARGALVRGDTAVLTGLAGELGCLTDPDPEDCAAGSTPPAAADPVVELVPVPALLLPPIGAAGPSLLLPRFPYGLDEPVVPALGVVLPQPAAGAWLRLALPAEQALPPPGPCEVRLLAQPSALGIQVLPWSAPPTGAPREAPAALPALAAARWDVRPGPLDRLQVLLPVALAGARIEGFESAAWAWVEAPAPLGDQPLPEPAWVAAAVERMRPAVGLCARAHFARQARRPRRDPPSLPGDLPEPEAVVALDAEGRVEDAVPLNGPWNDPDAAACLRANLRLLPPAERPGSLDVLRLGAAAAPPPPEAP